MSGTSSGVGNSSGVQYGYNVAPISFAGISSGIDYNSIINKTTANLLYPNTKSNDQIAQYNAANSELIKINGLLASVQNTLSALSQPSNFNTFAGTSSNTAVTTAAGIPGVSAQTGTYNINVAQLATATRIVNAPESGTTSALDPTKAFNAVNNTGHYAVTLQVPANGQGKLTVNGQQIVYGASSTLNQIVTSLNAIPGITASINGAGVFSISSAGQPLAIGGAGDVGNLLQVLKLDTAQVNNLPGSGSVTGTSSVGGINVTNGFAGANLNIAGGPTSGSFTINGVAIAVDVTKDNIVNVLNRITASNAGVNASYNTATNQITLTNKNLGPQSVVIGAAGDTSNFLTAVGLTSASGATSTVGKQSQVTVTDPFGNVNTIYAGSNSVTNAIAGITLGLTGLGVSTVNVAQDNSSLLSSINNFVSAYNAAIGEIDLATQAPVVNSQTHPPTNSGAPTTPQSQTSQPLSKGGVLYGDITVSGLKDRLVALVSGVNTSTGSSTYNSLSSIGLALDSSVTQLTQQNSTATPSAGTTISNPNQAFSAQGGLTSTTFDATTGKLQQLDLSKFNAAFAANPTAISSLFNGSRGITTQIGSYLTGVTGFPTQLATGFVGTIPAVSLLQNDENQNSANITSLQQQIARVTDNANLQADTLRKSFISSEGIISKYQSLQSQLANLFHA